MGTNGIKKSNFIETSPLIAIKLISFFVIQAFTERLKRFFTMQILFFEIQGQLRMHQLVSNEKGNATRKY